MLFKDKAKESEHKRLYYQRKKQMAHQQANTFIREIKNALKRDVSANSAATELMDEFAEIYKSQVVENKI